MLSFFKRHAYLAGSLLLWLTGCQAVDGYANKLVSMFTGLLSGLANDIRFPSFFR